VSIKRAHLDELQRIRQRVNALFEEALFGSGLPAREEREPGTWTPAVDVVETDDAFVLVAELPGVRREDIDVEVDDRRLEISGRRLPVEEGQSFVRMERSYAPSAAPSSSRRRSTRPRWTPPSNAACSRAGREAQSGQSEAPRADRRGATPAALRSLDGRPPQARAEPGDDQRRGRALRHSSPDAAHVRA
jgi:hypothetical protein